MIGGGGGQYHQMVGGLNGATLARLEVWVGGWQIRGIHARLTNGEELMMGTKDGPSKAYDFKAGERITRLSLWGNGAGSRAGWIEFDTSAQGHFSHGMNQWGRKSEYRMDVGSGICVGVYGRSGADVDCVGFAFIKPLASARLTNVSFPTRQLDAITFPPRTVLSQSLRNASEVEQTQKRVVSYTDAQRDSFTTEGSLELSFEAAQETGIEVGIPDLGKATGKNSIKFGTKVTTRISKTLETSHSETQSYEFPLRIPPKSTVTLEAWIYSGEYQVDFTGSLELRTQDGETATVPISGTYTGVQTSQVYTEVHQEPLAQMAADVGAPMIEAPREELAAALEPVETMVPAEDQTEKLQPSASESETLEAA